MSNDERFGRSRRLVSGIEIRQILRTGRRVRRPHFDIFWLPATTGQSRFGVVVARAGHSAVARNRIRRRLKELWRKELRAQVGPIDVLVRTRRSAYEIGVGELRRQLLEWAADVQK